jgi:molybdopterin synthase sulfur carrier subunit
VKVLYFAWVRERIGRADEEIDVPPGITTTTALIEWLKGRGPEYAHALAEPTVVRVAVDRVYAARDASIAGAGEIAIIPPMTGG